MKYKEEKGKSTNSELLPPKRGGLGSESNLGERNTDKSRFEGGAPKPHQGDKSRLSVDGEPNKSRSKTF